MIRRLGTSRLVLPIGVLCLNCCAPAPVAPGRVDTAPEAPAAPAPVAHAPRTRSVPPPELPLEQRERERAQTLMREGRWAEAVPHWEVLHLLHPEQATYADKLAEARSHAAQVAAEQLQEAQRARQEGQTERAIVFYLKVLSADPANAAAAQGLRDIDRESARRTYAGTAARVASGDTPTRKPAPPPSAAERRDLDAGIMLLHQGDYFAAVQALESYSRKYPRDDLGRKTLRDAYIELGRHRAQEGRKEEALTDLEKAQDMPEKNNPELARTIQTLHKEIAEDYYQQGMRAQASDLEDAIRLFEKCLKYDPEHVQAARRLDRARRMEQNLRSLPDSSTR